MKSHKDIIAYFEGKKSEAHGRLVAVRDRVTRACGDLDELNRRLDEMAERFRGPRGALIDIGVLRDAKDYKAMLGADIDRKRVEIETLGRIDRFCVRIHVALDGDRALCRMGRVRARDGRGRVVPLLAR